MLQFGDTRARGRSEICPLASVVVLAALCAITGCSSTIQRHITGVVVDEHGAAVSGARVIVGYNGWSLEPYLVWDHFYSAESVTDGRGVFRIELTAPERLMATVETENGAIRNAAVSAMEDLRLVTPAAIPECARWSYSSPTFLVGVPIGVEAPLSSANTRQSPGLNALQYRFLIERATDRPRDITLTVRAGDSSSWFPESGIYGGMLNYHPSLERFDYRDTLTGVRLGQAKGVLILRTEDVYLILELGPGVTTESRGDGLTDSVLLPARWAKVSG